MRLYQKATLLSCLTVLMFGQQVMFAAKETGPVVTLGGNLSSIQQEEMRRRLGVPVGCKEIVVTTAAGQQCLGPGISGRFFSCALVEPSTQGLEVTVSPNITEVTPLMYKEVFITAGVEDGYSIKVDAPKGVTGHAALAGLLIALEKEMGKPIALDRKQHASKELTTTSNIADKLAKSENKPKASEQEKHQAVKLVNDLKKAVSDEQPKTQAEREALVKRVVQDLNLNIKLDEATLKQLAKCCENFAKLGLDWSTVRKQLQGMGDELKGVLNDKGKRESWIDAAGKFFADLWGKIVKAVKEIK
ncbi:MAG: hypothetical protein RLZ12_419 [Bacillota bacterium]|jgi:uncharacterized protein YpuA (DUF1002 family)